MQMSLICFVFFFSLAWFFRQIICMMLYSFHTSPFEALIDKKLTITDWDVMMSKFEKRDRQAIHVQKRKPNKIVWHLLNIVVYTNSKKKNLNDGHCVQDRYMSACTACEHILGSQTAFNNNWENHAWKWKIDNDI